MLWNRKIIVYKQLIVYKQRATSKKELEHKQTAHRFFWNSQTYLIDDANVDWLHLINMHVAMVTAAEQVREVTATKTVTRYTYVTKMSWKKKRQHIQGKLQANSARDPTLSQQNQLLLKSDKHWCKVFLALARHQTPQTIPLQGFQTGRRCFQVLGDSTVGLFSLQTGHNYLFFFAIFVFFIFLISFSAVVVLVFVFFFMALSSSPEQRLVTGLAHAASPS